MTVNPTRETDVMAAGSHKECGCSVIVRGKKVLAMKATLNHLGLIITSQY